MCGLLIPMPSGASSEDSSISQLPIVHLHARVHAGIEQLPAWHLQLLVQAGIGQPLPWHLLIQ